MTLFDQYGIKEVADVTLYSIHKKEDGSGNLYYVPALYLDTLKVSTTEKTAENTWAQGGIGNSRLINWDYGKTININLEDALCTPASLGLCWNGILSADWKNGKIEFNSETDNSITKLSRMEKARAIRHDPQRGTISNLLPKIKSDMIDDDFNLLKISSVVDGTDIRGFGSVNNHNYKWKMAIESAVKSIAVVPDRFFDITGKSYSIDWDRKISVHSLPDYENYKDAIIYKINSKGKFTLPPLAKIIYDAAIGNQGEQVELNFQFDEIIDNGNFKPKFTTLGQLINEKGTVGYEINSDSDTPEKFNFKVFNEGLIIAGTWTMTSGGLGTDLDSFYGNKYYFPLRGLSAQITPTIVCRTYRGQESGIINKASEEYKNIQAKAIKNSDLETIDENEIYYNIETNEWIKPEEVEEIPSYCFINQSDYMANEQTLKDQTNITFVIEDQMYFHYDVNEQCFKVNEDSTLYTQIQSSALSAFEENIGESLSKYMWNHTVDMINNDAGREYIDEAEYNYPIEKCDYLAIIVDNNDNYIPLTGVVIDMNNNIGLSSVDNFMSDEPEEKKTIIWFNPCPMVDVSQFKGLDMWIRFQSINEMIYFLITKYENDIVSIKAATIEGSEKYIVNKETTSVNINTGLEAEKVEGKLWAYINPHTMAPYDDDYWFHQGEPYYIKSLTLAPNNKKINGKRITVTADQWPGMYMMVGETWIRSRDTGDDMRMQIKVPLCKVRSDHTLTLEAEGEPTTFNLALEVAQPQSGELLEITAYEVRTKMVEGEDGRFYAVDGSSEVVIE